MRIIKNYSCNNNKYRIIVKYERLHLDEALYPEVIEWDEYHVQMKKFGFWITIKKFDATSEEDLCYNLFYDCLVDVDKNKPLALIEAEELFNAIVNPYKIM